MKKINRNNRFFHVEVIIYILGFAYTMMTVLQILYLIDGSVSITSKSLWSIVIFAITAVTLLLLELHMETIEIVIARETNIESKLIENMYQQFDDVDLSVFSQKFFESEDEVLNFILVKIPDWFMDADAEFLYESIKEGYLHFVNGKPYVTSEAKNDRLKVYYISGV